MVSRILLSACTFLFVPADRPEMFPKAFGSGTDLVILDLEDAVAADRKDVAREYLSEAVVDFSRCIVRINSTDTSWFEKDIATVASLPLAGLMVPKADLASVSAASKAGIPILALIETALGLSEIRSVATVEKVVRIAFGSIDYCADLGCDHQRAALLAARSEIVLASRLASMAGPLDGVTTSLSDGPLAESDARHAAALGFTGKLCIHPGQISPVRRGFRPDPEQVALAERILGATSSGVSVVNGNMIDKPVRLRAEALLERFKALNHDV